MKKIFILMVIAGAGAAWIHAEGDLTGYATRNGNGSFNLTGGSGGATVQVRNETELENALGQQGPLIIQVAGYINGNNQFDVASNKTIVGWGNVQVGGAGHLNGVGFVVRNGNDNIIFRNLIVSRVLARNSDAITLDDAHHIWVDHCEFFSETNVDKDFYDGLIDVTHGSDNVTISWNHFHDHWKGSLVGHSDNNSGEDAGRLHITYHHNYFETVNSRMPSLRFGTGHSFNNYFDNRAAPSQFSALTVISSRMGACVRVENNRSEGQKSSVLTDQSGTAPGEEGRVQLIGNEFSGSVATSPTCQLNVPYTYNLQSVANAVTAVLTQAGPTLSDPLSWGNSTSVDGRFAKEINYRIRLEADGLVIQSLSTGELRVEWRLASGAVFQYSETIRVKPGWNVLKNHPSTPGSYIVTLSKGNATVLQKLIVVP